MGGKLRVSSNGKRTHGGSVEVWVVNDLVSIISAYLYHHYNNKGYVGISTTFSVKYTDVLFGKYKKILQDFISLLVFPNIIILLIIYIKCFNVNNNDDK